MTFRRDDQDLLVRLLDAVPACVLLVDTEARVQWANEPAVALFGYPIDETIGRNVLDFLDPDWDPVAFESIATALEAVGMRQPMLFRAIRGDGTKIIVEVTANSQLHDPVLDGMVVHVRRWDERYLLDQVLEAMAASAPVDHTLRLLVQVAEADILDAHAAILCGRTGDRFDGVQASAGLDPALVGPMAGMPADVLEAWAGLLPIDEGYVVPVSDLPAALRDPAERSGYRSLWIWPSEGAPGEDPGVVVVAWRDEDHVDIDQTRRWAMARLARLAGLVIGRAAGDEAQTYAATHDALTGLANRAHFYDRLEEAATARNADGTPRHVGVIYLDLDGFKPVNDRHGHAVGDDVLAAVGRRLRSAVPDTELVARIGGDEFAVLCADVAGLDALGALAGRLVRVLREPVAVDGLTVQVGASAGAALGTAGACSPDDLVEAADVAMYEVKADGKGAWRLTRLVGS